MFRAHGGGAHTKVPLRVDDVPCPAIREFLKGSASARGPGGTGKEGNIRSYGRQTCPAPRERCQCRSAGNAEQRDAPDVNADTAERQPGEHELVLPVEAERGERLVARGAHRAVVQVAQDKLRRERHVDGDANCAPHPKPI